MTIDEILEHLYGEDFDPKHRLIEWTRQAIINGDIKSFTLKEVTVVALSNFRLDEIALKGTFSVSINGTELPDLFSCYLNGAGWFDFYVPGYDGPSGTQASTPRYVFPDVIHYTIGKLLRRAFPRLRPFGLDRSTGAVINVNTYIYDRGGLDVPAKVALRTIRMPQFTCTDVAPFHDSQSAVIKALWDELGRDGRVCLMPEQWDQLHKLLPQRSSSNLNAPLILAAWDSSDEEKKVRMREHIEWAIQHGVAEQVFDFLKTKADKWYPPTASSMT